MELDEALAEDEIRLVCRDALKGLQHMHRMGFLHRDIKGANIMVKRDGSVKLIDFGVSGRVSAAAPTRQTFIGTPYWMAPEVIENKVAQSPYDGSCDVWSLGITLLELAEKGPPLAELHPMKALLQIPYREPPALREPARWSADFCDFVARTLVKRPHDRWPVDRLLRHPWLAHCPDRAVLAALACRVPWALAAAGLGAVLAAMRARVLPLAVLAWGQAATLPLFVVAKVPQIALCARTRSAGQLSLATFALNTLGAAARVFTTLQELADPLMLAASTLSVLLNGTIALQIIYYSRNSKKQSPPEVETKKEK